MDRIDTSATADAAGWVHIHVGEPGVQVHIVVENTPTTPNPASLHDMVHEVYGSLRDVRLHRPRQRAWTPRGPL